MKKIFLSFIYISIVFGFGIGIFAEIKAVDATLEGMLVSGLITAITWLIISLIISGLIYPVYRIWKPKKQGLNQKQEEIKKMIAKTDNDHKDSSEEVKSKESSDNFFVFLFLTLMVIMILTVIFFSRL